MFAGVLALWTEIDQTTDVLQLDELQEIEFGKSGVRIPKNLGFNSKLFQFSFHEETHQLFIEMKNENSQTITPKTAANAFQKIFSIVVKDIKSIDEVKVTVAPRQDAITEMFSIDRIRTVRIKLVRPNPGVRPDSFQRVYDRMQSEHISEIDKTLRKARGADSIVLDSVHKDEVEVAASNGYVIVKGTEGGERVTRSTKDYPKEIELEETDGATTLSMLRAVAISNG